MEGEEIPVFAYTNGDEAELFLNGKSLGKKVKGVDKPQHPVDFAVWDGSDFYTPYRLRWDVPYKAGELKVVSYKEGKVVAEEVINTAGKAAKIRLIPDRTVISADGLDLSYVTVEVLDKKGNLCPVADNRIDFQVSGAGSIRAVGNGNASTTASFQDPFREAFSGKCMLIVQSADSEGDINIEASSKGLKSAKIAIEASSTQ